MLLNAQDWALPFGPGFRPRRYYAKGAQSKRSAGFPVTD